MSECYECQPKPAPKTFPGCTIRNTPSEPIHCIVWAKHLYSQLFGEPDADNDVSPDTALENGELFIIARRWLCLCEVCIIVELFVNGKIYICKCKNSLCTGQTAVMCKYSEGKYISMIAYSHLRFCCMQ